MGQGAGAFCSLTAPGDAAPCAAAGEPHFQKGCWQQALHAHQKALATQAAQQPHGKEAAAEPHACVGRTLEQAGNMQEVLLHCEHALEIKHQLSNDRKALELTEHAGGLAEWLGVLDEALAMRQEALMLVEQLSPGSGVAANVRGKAGATWQRRGEAKAAKAAQKRCADEATRLEEMAHGASDLSDEVTSPCAGGNGSTKPPAQKDSRDQPPSRCRQGSSAQQGLPCQLHAAL